MSYNNKFLISQVKLTPLEVLPNGDLCEKFYQRCSFCEKNCFLPAFVRPLYNKLSNETFFCDFCLRNNFHTRNNRNVFILTFRSIIGQFYQQNYTLPQFGRIRLYLADIEDYLESHMQTGLLNPLFFYDPDSMLWFIDFSKVGSSKKKIEFQEICRTIKNILVCFNLSETLPNIGMVNFYNKYLEALTLFYQKRSRATRIYSPSLTTGSSYETKSGEQAKNFTRREMLIKIH